MARLKKVTEKHHRIILRDDQRGGDLILVRGGKRAYLWAGRDNAEPGCVVFSGPQSLRKLAQAILAEIPAEAKS